MGLSISTTNESVHSASRTFNFTATDEFCETPPLAHSAIQSANAICLGHAGGPLRGLANAVDKTAARLFEAAPNCISTTHGRRSPGIGAGTPLDLGRASPNAFESGSSR